ncbi:MAG: restriction endonuclease [Gallionellaceae bacterium]|nr:restriction endonuclease [Gallionellaceae bacterium]
MTKASGDQGIDVVASLGNVKAVFQCKKYSQPVGNAAVQEIFAGKQHEQAHVAAVVSNATYTPSAKQLATTTGVHLLHFSELPEFANRIGA